MQVRVIHITSTFYGSWEFCSLPWNRIFTLLYILPEMHHLGMKLFSQYTLIVTVSKVWMGGSENVHMLIFYLLWLTFWAMRFKHRNTDWRSVWNANQKNMLKLYLVSLWPFQLGNVLVNGSKPVPLAKTFLAPLWYLHRKIRTKNVQLRFTLTALLTWTNSSVQRRCYCRISCNVKPP